MVLWGKVCQMFSLLMRSFKQNKIKNISSLEIMSSIRIHSSNLNLLVIWDAKLKQLYFLLFLQLIKIPSNYSPNEKNSRKYKSKVEKFFVSASLIFGNTKIENWKTFLRIYYLYKFFGLFFNLLLFLFFLCICRKMFIGGLSWQTSPGKHFKLVLSINF